MGKNLRDLLTFITLSAKLTTGYGGLLILSTLLLLELTELQRIEQLYIFFQLYTATGMRGDEHACIEQMLYKQMIYMTEQETWYAI